MKHLRLFLILSLQGLFITALRATPAELVFLETLLPNSEHLYTHAVGMTPTGMIISKYKGADKIETVVAALNKTLGVEFKEIPVENDNRLTPFIRWSTSDSSPPAEHKRFQVDGITVDIVIRRSFYEGDGTNQRMIIVCMVKKGL